MINFSSRLLLLVNDLYEGLKHILDTSIFFKQNTLWMFLNIPSSNYLFFKSGIIHKKA